MNHKKRCYLNYDYHGINLFKKHHEIYGNSNDIVTFQSKCLSNCRNLYSYKLFAHYGCVNAVEFSHGSQELLASGGDDKRVLLWNVGQALLQKEYKPVVMIGTHISNIFCIAFNAGNNKVLSSGNDEQVLVHDVHTKQVVNIHLREDAVYSISSHPNDPFVFVTAAEDGKLHLTDTRQAHASTSCIANYVSAFHGVAFNPVEPLFIAAAHSKEGVALWDSRKPKSAVLCYGAPLARESTMSVQFNQEGSQLLVLRRKKFPRVYKTHCSIPYMEAAADGYFNSCTMKSGCFAGIKDEYFVSGSDDFKIYMWKIPELSSEDLCYKIDKPHIVLRGHRSIVNQVRYNRQNHVLVSSGVEKHLNLWSPLHYPIFTGQAEKPSFEKERPLYLRHQYIDLVLRSGTTLTHDYETESTLEDPRMIAFFDSLLQHDQNHSSDDSDSSSDGEDIGSLRGLHTAIMSSSRTDGRETTSSSSSSDSTGTESESTVENCVIDASQIKATSFTIERDARLQRLRESLHDVDDDDVIDAETTGAGASHRSTSSLSSHKSRKVSSEPKNTTENSPSSQDLRYSDEESDEEERRAGMRKRNAFRRKRGRASKTSTGATSSYTGDSDPPQSDADAYGRSLKKLRRSIETTNERFEKIANEMATAVEKAVDSDHTDSDECYLNDLGS